MFKNECKVSRNGPTEILRRFNVHKTSMRRQAISCKFLNVYWGLFFSLHFRTEFMSGSLWQCECVFEKEMRPRVLSPNFSWESSKFW